MKQIGLRFSDSEMDALEAYRKLVAPRLSLPAFIKREILGKVNADDVEVATKTLQNAIEDLRGQLYGFQAAAEAGANKAFADALKTIETRESALEEKIVFALGEIARLITSVQANTGATAVGVKNLVKSFTGSSRRSHDKG